MAQGITLRFQVNEYGDPAVLLIRDLFAVCKVCGRESVQRYYDETPFHPFTVGKFRNCCADAPLSFSLICEQCGIQLDPLSVKKWSVVYGFPLSDGLITGLGIRNEHLVQLQFLLAPYGEFSAQMHPLFEVSPNDRSIEAIENLTEDDIYKQFNRYLNLKSGWRRLIRRSLEGEQTTTEGEWLTPHLFALSAPDQSALIAEISIWNENSTLPSNKWITLNILDPLGQTLGAPPSQWLPKNWIAELNDAGFHLLAACPVHSLLPVLDRALSRLPIKSSWSWSDDTTIEVLLFTDQEINTPVVLPLDQIVTEALFTGLAPEDRILLWLDDAITALLDPVESTPFSNR